MEIFNEDEKAVEIQKTFSYDGYQVVRRELFAHQREAQMTIRTDSISFNTACIAGMEDAVYIQILVSRDQKRVAIRRCEKNDRDAVRWCSEKQDKRMTRKIVAKKFSEMIYQMMNWDNLCRYKLLGHQIEYQGEMLYVFELDEAEIFREKPKRTKQELEKMKQEMTEEELEALLKNEAKVSRTPFYPKDLDGTYGLPVDQHENHTTLQSLADYKGSGELLSQNENQDQLGET